jgi:hypothetical protein
MVDSAGGIQAARAIHSSGNGVPLPLQVVLQGREEVFLILNDKNFTI